MMDLEDILNKALVAFEYQYEDRRDEELREAQQDLATMMKTQRIFVLSTEAYEVLCGLVQPEDVVQGDKIFSEAWWELRDKFPLNDFVIASEKRGAIFYNPSGDDIDE